MEIPFQSLLRILIPHFSLSHSTLLEGGRESRERKGGREVNKFKKILLLSIHISFSFSLLYIHLKFSLSSLVQDTQDLLKLISTNLQATSSTVYISLSIQGHSIK